MNDKKLITNDEFLEYIKNTDIIDINDLLMQHGCYINKIGQYIEPKYIYVKINLGDGYPIYYKGVNRGDILEHVNNEYGDTVVSIEFIESISNIG